MINMSELLDESYTSPAMVLSRLSDNAKSDVSKIEGSFAYDMLASNALEFAKSYGEMNLMLEAAFADTSWGKYLTMRASEHGIDRKQAQAAKVILTFSGETGAWIIKHSLAETADKIQYYTDDDAVVGDNGIATVSAHCGTVGADGNVPAKAICKIPYSIPMIVSVSNAAPAYDGFDAETDAALLERYLAAVRTPATSGNVYHYQRWVMSVPGVGLCKVLPLWQGNGTVKVIVIDDNGHTASKDLIKRVSDYIEDKRPIGATVTISSPMPLAINVQAHVTGVYDLDKIKHNISDYLRQNMLAIRKISIAKIGAILIDSGVADYDYTTLMINGANKDISITDDVLPVVGQVTLTNG